MTKRIRLTIIMSAPDFPYQDVIDNIAPELGQLFAGACCQPIDGIWSKDGEHEKLHYQSGQQEKGMKILLSVMPEQEQKAKQQVKELLQRLKEQLNLAISWVHIEQEEVYAHHIQLT